MSDLTQEEKEIEKAVLEGKYKPVPKFEMGEDIKMRQKKR